MRVWIRRGGGSAGAWFHACVVLLLLLLVAGLPAGTSRAEDDANTARWESKKDGLEVFGLSSLRIHPRAPEIMWAHVHGLGVASTEDGGLEWVVRQQGIDPRHVPGPREPVEISLDPRDEKVLWLATKGYVYLSEDQGATWKNVSSGALASWSWDRSRSTMAIRGVVVDPKKSLRVLAGTRTEGAYRGGLFESTDGGKTWLQIAGDDIDKSELGYDAWPIVLDPRTEKNVAVGGSNGFWFSDDRGRKFKRADPGEIGYHDVRALTEISGRSKDLHLCDGRGVWSSRDGGKRWGREPELTGDCVTVAVDEHNRKRLYAVLRDQGLMASEDARHVKWDALGHAELDVHEVTANPRDKARLYLVSPTTGLHISTDDGATATPIRGNLPTVVPRVVMAVIHPVDRDRAMGLTNHGNVFLSSDRGETWKAAGRLGMVPTFLAGDATAKDTWWATGRELMRSPDNGATWEVLYRPDDPEDRLLGLRRLADGRLFMLLERSRQILHSKDGGKTWQVTKPPSRSPGAWATSFDVDPANHEHLLMACRSLAPQWTPKDLEGGVWESWDGGSTWKLLQEGLLDDGKPRRNWNRGRHVAFDASSGVMLYAADGLGLYARLPHDPAGKKPETPPTWIDISPSIPSLEVNVLLLQDLPGEEGTQLLVQAEGENDTRTFVRAPTSRVRERLEPGWAPAEDTPPLWTDLPDPPASLASLVADPHVEGRLLGTDRDGAAGVLVYGVPHARPPEAPEEHPTPPPPEPVAPPSKGLLAFTAGADGQVRIWSLAEGKVLSGLAGSTKEVLALALAPDESVLAVGGADKTILLYDASNGTKRDTALDPDRYASSVNALAFGPDSKHLYAGMQECWSIVEWNVETGETRAFDAHTAGVTCVVVAPDGKRLFSGSRDQTVRAWDVASAQCTSRMDLGTEVLCLALSPDGSLLYAGGRGASVRVYDTADGTELAKADVQTAYISGLALSPDGKLLYVAGDRGIVTLDAASLGEKAGPLSGPTKPIFCVAVSKEGAWILGGDSDNGVWLWHAGETKPYWFNTSAHVGPVHAVALTPDVAGGANGGGGDDAGGAGGSDSGEGGATPPGEGN